MKPWETPVSTVYSCEELPAETTLGHLVLLNDKIRTKYRTWNPRRLVFVKKIHISVFGYIKCYSSVSLFKTPSNPVEQEDFDSSNLTFQVFIF